MKSMLTLGKMRFHGSMTARGGPDTEPDAWLVFERYYDPSATEPSVGDVGNYLVLGGAFPFREQRLPLLVIS
jgi:hypothetical protein